MPILISIGDEGGHASDPDKIQIFEHTFTIRRVTRSVQKKIEVADRKLNEALQNPDADGDVVVAAIVDACDVLLEPNGQKTLAKTVLLKAWKDETLAVDQLHQLYEGMQEAAARRPPTSLATT